MYCILLLLPLWRRNPTFPHSHAAYPSLASTSSDRRRSPPSPLGWALGSRNNNNWLATTLLRRLRPDVQIPPIFEYMKVFFYKFRDSFNSQYLANFELAWANVRPPPQPFSLSLSPPSQRGRETVPSKSPSSFIRPHYARENSATTYGSTRAHASTNGYHSLPITQTAAALTPCSTITHMHVHPPKKLANFRLLGTHAPLLWGTCA